MRFDVLVWGVSGQAKVLRPIIAAAGGKVVASVDRDPAATPLFGDARRFQGWDDLMPWLADRRQPIHFTVAVGRIGADRMDISERLLSLGCEPMTLIHPQAWVADTAKVGRGCQILGLAAVSEEAEIGDWCILNTNCSVDHESRMARGVHVMPGATLAGCVEVGDCASIGSGATILPKLRIGARAVVGAGAVVTRDVEAGAVVVGVPARPVQRNR